MNQMKKKKENQDDNHNNYMDKSFYENLQDLPNQDKI